MKLIAGILMAFLSIILLGHWFSYLALMVDDRPVDPFLNNMLETVETSAVGFLATVMFVGIGFYLIAATMRGNVKFGLRFFFVSFYPLSPRETFVNSFFANCLVINIWMVALTHFLNWMFKGYLRGTQVAKIFDV